MRALLAFTFLVLFAALALGESATREQMVDDQQFLREANYTINYSRIPWVLLGVTPALAPPQQYRFDTIIAPPPVLKIDPRTCPGEVALCYQVREHNSSENITYGKNYSAMSSYVLPERRVKMFACLGNDTACVQEATNCFCPRATPEAPIFINQFDACSDASHLCLASEAGLVLCEGNLTWCKSQYLACGCGKYATCAASMQNTCLNGRHELVVCAASISDCLRKYSTCFCGDQAQYLQAGCDALTHACVDDGKNATCYGSFNECALRNDACEC